MFKTKQKVFHKKLLMHLKLTATNDSILKANFVQSKNLWNKN